MEVIVIFTVSMLWLISLIGSCVTGTLYSINVGEEGYYDWEKKLNKNFCKKNLEWFSLFAILFAIANYLFYIVFTH